MPLNETAAWLQGRIGSSIPEPVPDPAEELLGIDRERSRRAPSPFGPVPVPGPGPIFIVP